MFKIRFYRKYTVSIERLILDVATLRAPRREEATISSRVLKNTVCRSTRSGIKNSQPACLRDFYLSAGDT